MFLQIRRNFLVLLMVFFKMCIRLERLGVVIEDLRIFQRNQSRCLVEFDLRWVLFEFRNNLFTFFRIVIIVIVRYFTDFMVILLRCLFLKKSLILNCILRIHICHNIVITRTTIPHSMSVKYLIFFVSLIKI